MGYTERVLDSPYGWLLVGAVLVALVLRNLLLLLLRRYKSERVRDRRLTLLFVYAAAAIAVLTAALVVFGIPSLMGTEQLVFFGVATGLLVLAFVFVRAVGIPLLFLISAFVVLGVYLTRPWHPVVGATELVTITALSTSGDALTLELKPYPAEPTGEEVVRLPGSSLRAEVELVHYHPYWFLLGRRLGARIVRLQSEDEDVVLPDGCGDEVCRYIRRHLPSVPGLSMETTSTISVPIRTLSRYAVLVTPEAQVALEPR